MMLSLILLFIILLVIIIIVLNNNYNQKENFECKIKSVVSYIEDPYLKKIRNYLDTLNNTINIYTLKQNCEISNYNEYDLEPRLKQQLIHLILPFFNKINKELSIKIEITKLLNVDIELDNKGNKRYIIDLFTYETIHFYSCRFIIDLILFYNNKEIHLNRFVLSNAKINNHQYLSGNDIHNLTTNYVENPLNRTKNNCNLLGYDNSNLEFTSYNNKGNSNRNSLKSKYHNPWIIPTDSPFKLNYIYKKTDVWDEDGVLYNHNNRKKNDSFVKPIYYYPYNSPTITGIPFNKNNYKDLFSITRGIIKPLFNN